MSAGQPVLAVCGMLHESNVFADSPTTFDDFLRLDADAIRMLGPTSGTEIGGALLAGADLGAHVEPTTFAFALSSGPVEDDAASALVDELVSGIAAVCETETVDAVVACMHGSMCAASDPDVEGRALTALRAAVGPDVPIVATLDWHATVTEPMVDAADVLIAYRTYPHIDQEDRGREAATLALELAAGGARLHSRWIPVPMMVAGPATRHDHPTMAAVLAAADAEARRDDGIRTWSVAPGFARSDSAGSGAHVYVAGSDRSAVDGLAEGLAGRLWWMRQDFEPELAAVDEALERASESIEAGSTPVVLSDQGDNPGGGAPATSTVLLEALEGRGLPGTLVASLMAPDEVRECSRAGVGSELKVALGGFTAVVDVVALADGNYTIQSPTHPNVPIEIGPLALVRTPGAVEVVLTSSPLQNEDIQVLETLGVDLLNVNAIVVKSNVHFRAVFEPIASAVIDVDTPGISTPKLVRLPYQHVRRPIWPLDPHMKWSPV